MSVITEPESILVTDLEFIFLGGTKLSHTIRPEDRFIENEHTYQIYYPNENEAATVYKTSLLQLGRRERKVSKVEETAVQKVVREIKEQEARAQGATTKAAPAPRV